MTTETTNRQPIGQTGRYELEVERVRVRRAWEQRWVVERRYHVYDTASDLTTWIYSADRQHYAEGWVEEAEAEYLAEEAAAPA